MFSHVLVEGALLVAVVTSVAEATISGFSNLELEGARYVLAVA